MGLAVAHNNVTLAWTPDAVEYHLAAITNLSWSGINREMIEVDAIDIEDGWKTFIKGHKDGGELTVTCNYIPDNTFQVDLLGDLSEDDNSENYEFTLTLPDAAGDDTTHVFTGAISGMTITANNGEVLTIEFTIKITECPDDWASA
jgi:hypothetical protein